ncbi:MAG: DUF6569 family protein [Flavobacteriales bacterium]
MRHLTVSSIGIAFSLALNAQYNTENLSVPAAAPPDVSYMWGKLAIYPVIANAAFNEAHSHVERTTPLKKAIASGALKVTEQGDGGQVNSLLAKNTSRDTIYLMQGEVVTGGQQDRMLAQDVLLAPGQTVDVAAFCVEHNRWQTGSDGKTFSASPGVGAQKMRRSAAVKKDQGAVWDNVAGYLKENEVSAPTGTFAALQEDSTFQREMTAYRTHFAGLFSGRQDVIGVMAVSGGQVIGCDLFATPAMFHNAYDGLLAAYITEAVSNGSEAKLGPKEAQAFLERLLVDEDGLEDRMKDRGSIFKEKGRTLRVSYF